MCRDDAATPEAGVAASLAAISGPERSWSNWPIGARGLASSDIRSVVMTPALLNRHGRAPGSRQVLATPRRAALISTSVSFVASGSVTVVETERIGAPRSCSLVW